MTERPKNELRCFCSRSPLLATYGVNSYGKLFVHVKVFKQRRIYGEILVTEGRVKLRCRECLRWHTVVIHDNPNKAILQEDKISPLETNTSHACIAMTERIQ